ncbi:MAG: alpha/beta fold hydrolase, partial [Chloroflexota bacterium]
VDSMKKHQICIVFALVYTLSIVLAGCSDANVSPETINEIQEALISARDRQAQARVGAEDTNSVTGTDAITNANADVSISTTISPTDIITDDGLLPPIAGPAIIPPSAKVNEEYTGFTVDALSTRLEDPSYGTGRFVITQFLGSAGPFLRYLVSYQSDAGNGEMLDIHGFMNVPVNASPETPAPVVLVLHGYVTPERYNTFAYTTRYADRLAEAGYVTIHPNYRNHPPSDSDPNYSRLTGSSDFRVGYAIDILDLVGIIQKQGGVSNQLPETTDVLASIDPNNIGLWGHSMGGGITLRVITVNPTVQAAVVYGSMSGDEQLNHERVLFFTDGVRGNWPADAKPTVQALWEISPANHYDRISTPVSIHHGRLDDQVPLVWSLNLCTQLQGLRKTVECFTYDTMPHTFRGAGDTVFIQRTVTFFDQYLK